jgi:hypothetical protein
VSAAVKEAAGGLLFIDEAYELGKGVYGEQAMTTLMEMMTLVPYEKSTVFIIAGYPDEMEDMFLRNPGFSSRFKKTLHFPPWTSLDSTRFVLEKADKSGYLVEDGVHRALEEGFSELCNRPGWANARDAQSVWRDRILYARSERVIDHQRETALKVTIADVEAGMQSFLADRPKGPPRNRLQSWHELLGENNSVRYATDSQQQQAPRHQTAQKEHLKLSTGAEEEADGDIITEWDQRKEEEKQLEEEARLIKLREEEAELRRKIQEAKEAAEAAEAAAKAAKEAEKVALQKALQEAQEALEKLEKARKKVEEEANCLLREQLVQTRIREMHACPAGFSWDLIGNTYRCKGGSHTISADDSRLR